ncbi:TPA: NADH-quinone oxidoreductase subunit D [Candidatus Poribacteria bacterium]|nr:NADH-quinone oxidoreductase subunit D [Candidatus Poribacteria bacterium]
MSDLVTEEMMVSMGPQHPSTHGVLRLMLTLDGEIVKEAVPHIGYLHRCFEKHAENLTYPQIIPYTDRLDYMASMNNNLGFCVGVERLMGLEVPQRAEYLRVLVAELNRIASHQISLGSYGLDMGAFTPFLYVFRDREIILDIFEELCGARLTYNYVRIGGVARDASPALLDRIEEFVDYFEPWIDKYNNLFTYNKIFIERTANVGVMSKGMAINYGVTGPNLRGSGFQWDLRRDDPYSIYDRFDFNIPVGNGEFGTVGDSWNRYRVRLWEMEESVKIIRQVLNQIPEGPIMAQMRGAIRPPEGEIYARTETPRGELGFYIVSDGSPKPTRVKVRSPCFTVMSVFRELSRGCMIADLMAILGSFDIVLGEIDR